MIQQTSLEAYNSVDLNRRELQVLNIIRASNGFCNKEIAQRLGWDINRVTGRVKGLRDKNKVIQLGTKVCCGRTVMTWGEK